MKLEEALSNIINLNEYSSLSTKDFSYWRDRILSKYNSLEENNYLKTNFHKLILSHNFLRNDLDLLNVWSNSKFPNPKDYGKNAEKWLKLKKLKKYESPAIYGSVASGMVMLMYGYFSDSTDFDSTGSLLILGGMVGAFVSSTYNFNYYKLMGEKDSKDYLNDMLLYFSRDLYFGGLDSIFSKKYLNSFKNNLNNHIIELEQFTNKAEKYSSSNIENCINLCIELNNFTKNLDDTLLTIRKNKSYYKPLYDTEMSVMVHKTTEDLSLQSFQNGISDIAYLANKFLR